MTAACGIVSIVASARLPPRRATCRMDLRLKMTVEPSEVSLPSSPYSWLLLPAAVYCPPAGGKIRRGISGAKATGAVLTGGVSVLATGLSRNERTTQAHCFGLLRPLLKSGKVCEPGEAIPPFG